jgi:hypothetical protein
MKRLVAFLGQVFKQIPLQHRAWAFGLILFLAALVYLASRPTVVINNYIQQGNNTRAP